MSEPKVEEPKTLPVQVDRLIHYTELNRSGWWPGAVERIALATIWLAQGPIEMQAVVEGAADALGSNNVAHRTEAAVGRMVADGSVIELPDGTFKVSEEVAQSLAIEWRTVTDEQRKVAQRLGDLLRSYGLPVEDEEAWSDYETHYLVPLLQRMGAHIYQLFTFQEQLFEADEKRNTDLVRALVDKYGEEVRDALVEFMNPDDPILRGYILRRLAGQFARGAAGLSDDEIKAMRPKSGKTVRIDLLLDTNFLFSVLDLHENPGNQTTDDLLLLIDSVSGSVNVRMMVLPETVEEARRVLRDVMFRLKNATVSGSVATASRSIHASGLVSSYLGAASKASGSAALTPDAYFGPYEKNLITAAKDRRIVLYTPARTDYSTRQDVVDAIHDQQDVQTRFRPKGPKPYEANAHDMILWHVARDCRPGSVDSPLDAGTWIVTLDYGLVSFDRHKRSRPPLCILPSDLISMLQFWVPRNDELDKALVGSLREPLMFVEFDNEAERATVGILSTLSRYANAGDLSPDLVRNIVTNEALRTGMLGVTDPTSAGALELLDSAIIEESRLIEARLGELAKERADLANRRTEAEHESAMTKLDLDREREDRARLARQKEELEAELGEARRLQTVGEALEKELEEARQRSVKREARLGDLEKQMDAVKSESATRKRRTQRVLGFAVVVASVLLGCLVGVLVVRFADNLAAWLQWGAAVTLGACIALAGTDLALSKSAEFAGNRLQRALRRIRSLLIGTVATLVLAVVANLVYDEIKSKNSPTSTDSNVAPQL